MKVFAWPEPRQRIPFILRFFAVFTITGILAVLSLRSMKGMGFGGHQRLAYLVLAAFFAVFACDAVLARCRDLGLRRWWLLAPFILTGLAGILEAMHGLFWLMGLGLRATVLIVLIFVPSNALREKVD